MQKNKIASNFFPMVFPFGAIKILNFELSELDTNAGWGVETDRF
jgi:hypothetical protein